MKHISRSLSHDEKTGFHFLFVKNNNLNRRNIKLFINTEKNQKLSIQFNLIKHIIQKSISILP